MSSFGSKDSKRKRSSGGGESVASSEDEQEAEKDRMETKRHREKKRRFEITHAVENLSKMIMKIDPEILQFKHGGMNDNLRGISGIGSRLGGGTHYGNNCASASFHRSLNRTDVITCACEVMDRLHQENERLRQELKALGNDSREDGQRLFPNSPVSMMNGTGGTITTKTTTGATAAATNSGLMNHLPNGGTGRMTGTVSNNIGSNTESKLHDRSLLANSLGLSHPTGTNSHQNSKQQQQQQQQQHQHHQATPDVISPQMLQNQYNILQQLIQLQQLQQQYPLAMQQLTNSTCSLGIPPGLFPTNTLFGGGGTTNNFSAALNAASLSSLNPASSLSLQQLLLSRSLQQQQQQGSNHDEMANAPGGNMMMHNFGNIGHESKGNGRIGGEGDSFT